MRLALFIVTGVVLLPAVITASDPLGVFVAMPFLLLAVVLAVAF